MRKVFLASSLTLALMTSAAWVNAGDADDASGADKSGEVKRDPKGVKGISPYREKLAKGRAAFVAGDKQAAIAAFDEAIAEDSERITAYLLKAQAQLAAGDLQGASTTAATGKTKRGNEETTAKLLFFIADVDEQKAAPASKSHESKLSEALRSTWERVKEGWGTYAAYLTSHTTVPNYQATADERNKQVDARVKREEAYGAVAERILKNQQKPDEK